MRQLECRDIYVSSSSACSSKIKGSNTTFDALGIHQKYHKNVVRVSIGVSTLESEVVEFVQNLQEIYKSLLSIKRR